MRIVGHTKGIVATLLAGLLIAGGAGAQSGDSPPTPEARPNAEPPEPEGRDKSPDEDVEARPDSNTEPDSSATTPPSPADEVARKAHLDGLLRRLSDPEAKDWQRIQSQVIQAWNQSGSPSMNLLASRADQAVAKKDYATALLHLNDLVRLAPDFAEGWNKRATVHFLKEDYGPSLEDIARVLKLEPRHFGALSGLGIILDRIGDPNGALEAYRRAIAINPHLPGIKEGIEKLEKQVEGERL